jgi:murein peptide amidase A
MALHRPTYHDLAGRWKALRATHDVRVREVACVGAARTLLCADYGETHRPMVSLSAGVHGDEPAGPIALLELVSTNALDPAFSYRIWPCTNPTGFDAATRENVDGVDVNRTFGRGGSSPEAKAIVMANRDRKFVASIDLHEDDEAEAFYTYEYGFDEPLFPGALRPDPIAEAGVIGGLSLTLLLIRNATPRALTIETPSSRLPLEARVADHVQAVTTVLRRLSTDSQSFVK